MTTKAFEITNKLANLGFLVEDISITEIEGVIAEILGEPVSTQTPKIFIIKERGEFDSVLEQYREGDKILTTKELFPFIGSYAVTYYNKLVDKDWIRE